MAKGTERRRKAKIVARLHRLETGNPGDVASVGDGISEMRIHSGAGYRIYFRRTGETITILYGGDKHSQNADIAKAKEIRSKLED